MSYRVVDAFDLLYRVGDELGIPGCVGSLLDESAGVRQRLEARLHLVEYTHDSPHPFGVMGKKVTVEEYVTSRPVVIAGPDLEGLGEAQAWPIRLGTVSGDEIGVEGITETDGL